jgi:hypothetical protein
VDWVTLYYLAACSERVPVRVLDYRTTFALQKSWIRTSSRGSKKSPSGEGLFYWLAVSFWNITIAKENEPDVKEIRNLIDENTKEEEQVC